MFRSFGFQVGPSLRKKIASHLGGSGEVANYLPVVVGLELFQLVLNPTDAILKFGLNSAIRSMGACANMGLLSASPASTSDALIASLFNLTEYAADR